MRKRTSEQSQPLIHIYSSNMLRCTVRMKELLIFWYNYNLLACHTTSQNIPYIDCGGYTLAGTPPFHVYLHDNIMSSSQHSLVLIAFTLSTNDFKLSKPSQICVPRSRFTKGRIPCNSLTCPEQHRI